MTTEIKFTAADQDAANQAWGANCGPGALAAIAGLTLDEVRPALVGFDKKRYTNPAMMFGALDRLRIKYKPEVGIIYPVGPSGWPRYGLCRIQWEGPWTKPGVPPRVAYRYTHWVGAQHGYSSVGIFDINAMGSGGWIGLNDWADELVPWLLNALYKKASGLWHITHSIEIAPPS